MAAYLHPARPAQAPGGVALAMAARWQGEGRLGGRVFPFHPDVSHYCAWFCRDVPTFLDHRLGLFPEAAQEYEEVCRALNHRCRILFRRRRGIPDLRHASEVIGYHQRRNEQAAISHKKERHRCVI